MAQAHWFPRPPGKEGPGDCEGLSSPKGRDGDRHQLRLTRLRKVAHVLLPSPFPKGGGGRWQWHQDHLLCLPSMLPAELSQPPAFTRYPDIAPSPTLGSKSTFVCVMESPVPDPDSASLHLFSQIYSQNPWLWPPSCILIYSTCPTPFSLSIDVSLVWTAPQFGHLLIPGVLGIKAQFKNGCSKW